MSGTGFSLPLLCKEGQRGGRVYGEDGEILCSIRCWFYPTYPPLTKGRERESQSSLKPVAFSGCAHGFAPMPNLDIARHLTQWGLRRFTDEGSYYAWQRQSLAGRATSSCSSKRLKPGATEKTRIRSFMIWRRPPTFFPFMYSQRYDYYDVLGPVPLRTHWTGAQCVLGRRVRGWHSHDLVRDPFPVTYTFL